MANLLQYLAPLPQNPLQQGSPSLADAWEHNARAVRDYVAQQRAISAQRGLWNDQTGLPTMAGVKDAGGQLAQSLLMGTTAPSFRAYHGSPHSFDRFSLDKIGTGEGAQAYGHGLYFAENEGVARGYKEKLSDWTTPPTDASTLASVPGSHHLAAHIDATIAKFPGENPREIATLVQDSYPGMTPGNLEDVVAATMKSAAPAGSMYEVQINANPEHFLDWDKPLSEQHPVVQDAMLANLHPSQLTERGPVGDMARRLKAGDMSGIDGADAYTLANGYRDPAGASAALREAGIPGIRYLDGGSRGAGEGTYNHVVFSPESIEILRKYGIAGLMGGGAAAATQATEQ